MVETIHKHSRDCRSSLRYFLRLVSSPSTRRCSYSSTYLSYYLATLRYGAHHLLATAVPQIFHHIPNPLQIPVPVSDNTTTLIESASLAQAAYPVVRFWEKKNYQSDSDLTKISDSKKLKAQLPRAQGRNSRQYDRNQSHKEGGACCIYVLVRRWSRAGILVKGIFQSRQYSAPRSLSARRPLLESLEGRAVATEIYSQWSRRRKPDIEDSSATTSSKSHMLGYQPQHQSLLGCAGVLAKDCCRPTPALPPPHLDSHHMLP